MEAIMVTTKNFSWPTSSFIGFDSLFNELTSGLATQNLDSFPRYNVVKTGEFDYRIEVALAGYDEKDLSIEVKERMLTIKGEPTNTELDYIHKGISTRKFKREFRLADHVSVECASFVNGLLVIELHKEIPEEKRPRSIPIGIQPKPLSVLLNEEFDG
jgi:molecular chaperone IbpA